MYIVNANKDPFRTKRFKIKTITVFLINFPIDTP